jgi:hypothetical protein
LSRRPLGYGPTSACRAEAQRAQAEPPQTGAPTSGLRAALSMMSRAEAKRPLTSLKEQTTIETRFCVTKKVTKTDPRRLGGGGRTHGIVGCIHLRMHHFRPQTIAWARSPKLVHSKQGMHPTRGANSFFGYFAINQFEGTSNISW